MDPLAYVTRSNLVESIHYGDVAVCDWSGELVGCVGDPERRIYWRSSAKPMQALSVIHSGAADRFELAAAQIAICCASHHGSAKHVETVRSILDRIGLTPDALQCGTHRPVDTEERNRLMRGDLPTSPLHNNCSGKHSGMLATTLAVGGDPGRYLELDSPVQRLILADMSALSGIPVADIETGTDGCSAPTHAMPLRTMATCYARLVRPEGISARIQSAAPRIIAAMAAHPEMVSGRGSFNTELLEAYRGAVLAKGGAEGLFVIGMAELGMGVAVKVADGNSRALPPVILDLLGRLGVLDDPIKQKLSGYVRPQVKNCNGEAVGEIRAAELDM